MKSHEVQLDAVSHFETLVGKGFNIHICTTSGVEMNVTWQMAPISFLTK